MSDETKYEINVYCRQLKKDLTNLMDCLRKQDKDNKAILYEGRHLKKVILPYEEYQKMCQRLESVDNANPSEALKDLQVIENNIIYTLRDCDINDEVCQNLQYAKTKILPIEHALFKAQEQEKENAELKKVLSIIKEKDVNIWYLTVSTKVKNYKDYNSFLMNDKNKRQLTQEEFDLLKRWLECIE